MKFSLALAAIAAPGVLGGASCFQSGVGGAKLTYDIKADNVPNIGGVCDTLWKKLKSWGGCTVTAQYCRAEGTTLHWHFNVPIFCNKGMVSSAWYEATKNNYGALAC